jgi:hypothetical protein
MKRCAFGVRLQLFSGGSIHLVSSGVPWAYEFRRNKADEGEVKNRRTLDFILLRFYKDNKPLGRWRRKVKMYACKKMIPEQVHVHEVEACVYNPRESDSDSDQVGYSLEGREITGVIIRADFEEEKADSYFGWSSKLQPGM